MTEVAVTIDLQEEWLASSLGLRQVADLFPWQTSLLHAFPEPGCRRYALDIPTGLGKTSVMAIWLVARALGKPVPRRLVYVVDRRTVVDQATTAAEELRDWVERHHEVKERLGLGARPLPISTLRGQHLDNREWLEDPSIPAIIIGTVDMVGSRLLFEGYRTSRKMRPYHAGLLGVDVLLTLDEAHLVPPFERLLETIATNAQGFGPTDRVPPFVLMSLSATGAPAQARTYRLTDADRNHPVVRRRLDAPKHLRFNPLEDPKLLTERLAERAWALATGKEESSRVLVYCTRREVAQRVHTALLKQTRQALLLVGARRQYERQQAAKDLADLGFLAGSNVTLDGPAFLVATSAGEVGVDLDADHMVSDLVPWERMVQRFGRVNRRGDGAAILEVMRVLEVSPAEDIPKDSVAETNQERYLAPFRHLPHRDAGIDVSPGALLALRERQDVQEELSRACTSVPLHPELTRAHVEAWAMTSLPEHTGRPRIQPWLRGWESADPPQCAVAWRQLLPVPPTGEPDKELVHAFFEAAPVHSLEILETEAFRVAEWLTQRAQTLQKEGLEESRVVALILGSTGALQHHWTVARLQGADKRTREMLVSQLAQGTLVVDAQVGGLASGLLDRGHSEAAPDVHAHSGNRVRLEQGSAPEPGWTETHRLVVEADENGDPVRTLVVEERGEAATASENARSIAARSQLLEEHQSWVEVRARELAEAVAPNLAHVFALAARLHDEGKRARRWQLAFRAPADGAYAKTRGPLNVHLLGGYRHEFGSLVIAASHEAVARLSEEDRDLLLHLIAAHHGFARPLIAAEGCEDAPPSALALRRRDVAERFVRLQERWGPWGLAWLEALLRAADQHASRVNDEEGRR